MGIRFYGHIVDQQQVDAIIAEPESVWQLFINPPGDELDSIYLDKAWHGLHWLLCGDWQANDHPASWSVLGGVPVKVEADPAPRILGAADVVSVHLVLEGISDRDLLTRYDGPAMTEDRLYPDVWRRPHEPDDYLAFYLPILRAAYRRAAEREASIVQYVG